MLSAVLAKTTAQCAGCCRPITLLQSLQTHSAQVLMARSAEPDARSRGRHRRRGSREARSSMFDEGGSMFDRARICATVGCGRRYVKSKHRLCCSWCSVGGHTQRCDHDWSRLQSQRLRQEISECLMPGCGRAAGYGHTHCCTLCVWSSRRQQFRHTPACDERQALVAARRNSDATSSTAVNADHGTDADAGAGQNPGQGPTSGNMMMTTGLAGPSNISEIAEPILISSEDEEESSGATGSGLQQTSTGASTHPGGATASLNATPVSMAASLEASFLDALD